MQTDEQKKEIDDLISRAAYLEDENVRLKQENDKLRHHLKVLSKPDNFDMLNNYKAQVLRKITPLEF